MNTNDTQPRHLLVSNSRRPFAAALSLTLTMYLASVGIAQGTPHDVALMSHDGRLVCAEHGGGYEVVANRLFRRGWEVVRIWDANGGKLNAGDFVFIQAPSGHFWAAEGGGGHGSVVNANRPYYSYGWEAYRIGKADTSNGQEVQPGDPIFLRTYNGHLVTSGSYTPNGRLVADRTIVGDWEKFTFMPIGVRVGQRQVNVAAVDPAWVPVNPWNYFRLNDNGCQVVRYQIIDRPSGTNRPIAQYDTLIDAHIGQIDSLLPEMRRRNMKMIIDVHHAPGMKSERGLFGSHSAQRKLVTVWKRLAARYSHEEAVLGFDLVNEPDVNYIAPNAKSWSDLSDELVRVIRIYDPHASKMIYVEPASGNIDHIDRLAFLNRYSKITISVHSYRPEEFTVQGYVGPIGVVYPQNRPGFRRSDFYQFVSNLKDFRTRTGLKVHVGEFGVSHHADDWSAMRWLRDRIELLEANNIPWAVSDYDGENPAYPSFPSMRAHVLWNWIKP